jgi:hypothetical protein
MSNDFIAVYENAFSQFFCDEVINHFELMNTKGLCFSRQDQENIPKIQKDDLSLFAHDNAIMKLENTPDIYQVFKKIFWDDYYTRYMNEYAILKKFGSHSSYSFKVQKTEIGGGYHDWHCETANRECSHRILAWMVYLNNVEEGGETEFLYQHKRIKPKSGSILIFPAGFTHTHRGNPPLSNAKYVITGWIEF